MTEQSIAQHAATTAVLLSVADTTKTACWPRPHHSANIAGDKQNKTAWLVHQLAGKNTQLMLFLRKHAFLTTEPRELNVNNVKDEAKNINGRKTTTLTQRIYMAAARLSIFFVSLW